MIKRKFAVINGQTNEVKEIVEVNHYSGEEFSDIDIIRNLLYAFDDCYSVKLEDHHGIINIEYTYDKQDDIFKPKKVFSSWVYNEKRNTWEAPVPLPSSSKDEHYIWDEDIKNWVAL